MHIELITASVTAPGAGGAAATPLSGDSLTVKNGILSAGVLIASMWSTQQVAGFNQILFPSAHDTTRGFRAGAPIGVNPAQLPFGISMDVQPQELLSLTMAGSAVAGDVEQMSMLVRYGNLPGAR